MTTRNRHLRTPSELLILAICGSAAVIALSVRPVVAGDEPPVVMPIVQLGDPAPGLGEGVVFEDFAAHPTVEQIIDGGFPPPVRVSPEGDVSFHAYIGDDGVPALEGPSGLFRIVDGQIELVTLTDAPAPGTDTVFVGPAGLTFLFVPPTPAIHDGRVTFTMAFGDIPFAADSGVWSDRFGTLDAVALDGDNLPGMIPSDSMGPPWLLTNGGTIYIDAEVKHDTNCCQSHPGAGCDERSCEGIVCAFDPTCCSSNWDLSCGNAADVLCIECGAWEGVTDLHPEGLWRNRDGEFETLILTNEQAIGYSDGIVYGSASTSHLFGSVGSIAFDDQDRVAVTTLVKGPGIGTANNEAIYIETDNGLELFLREGTPAPPGLFDPGAAFRSNNTLEGAFYGQGMTGIKLNNHGALLFPAMIDIPGDPPVVPTLWTTRNGELELLVKGFLNGIAFVQPGTPAPGIPGGEFFAFPVADMNDQGDVLIFAFVETDDNIFTATFGFWVDRGEGFVPVGFEEGPVPEHPGVTFFPEINNVRGMITATLQPDGSVLFSGRFFNDQGNAVIGLFRQDADGSAHQIFETAQPVQIGTDPADVRILASLRMGEGIISAGQRPVELDFTDGSFGLYLFDAMSVDVIPGDVDGDGDVDAADFLALLAAWGPCPPAGACAADFDGDGTVGATDFLILLANWT